MPFVVTAAPSGSGPGTAVGTVLDVVAGVGLEPVPGGGWLGSVADAAVAVDVALRLVREPGWRVGVGAGPAPGDVRGAGPAALGARRAVEAARQRPTRLAVRGAVPEEAGHAQAVLAALAVLVQRRTRPAWAAVDLVVAGRTQAQAAAALGISRQAVGQRLAAGQWQLELELRPTAARLLARAAG